MELTTNTLAAGLAKAARVAGCFLRDATDVQDVVQAAAARLARALERGLVLRSVEGYLVRVARLEALRLLRRRRNWQNREGDGSMDPADVAIAGEELFDEVVLEELLARLREELAPAVRGWLEDQLSRLTVREIAARDGVDEAAVRMRRMRLVEAIMDSEVVQEFVEFPVTFRRLRHLMPEHAQAVLRNVGWNPADVEIPFKKQTVVSRWMLDRIALQRDIDNAVGQVLDVLLTEAIAEGRIRLQSLPSEVLLNMASRRQIDGFRKVGDLAAVFKYDEFPLLRPLVQVDEFFRRDSMEQLACAANMFNLGCKWQWTEK